MIEFKDTEILRTFEKVMGPTEVSFLFSRGENQEFNCLNSNNNPYFKETNYSLYDLNSLVRILLKKQESLEGSMRKEYWEGKSSDEICFVLEWNDFARKVIVFHTDQTKYFHKDELKELLENKNLLNSLFQKLIYRNEQLINDGQKTTFLRTESGIRRFHEI